jgi:hypothetical protein
VLGSVFARDHAVHVAIAPGRLAEAIVLEAGRLAGVLGAGGLGTATSPPHGVDGGHRRDGPMGQ